MQLVLGRMPAGTNHARAAFDSTTSERPQWGTPNKQATLISLSPLRWRVRWQGVSVGRIVEEQNIAFVVVDGWVIAGHRWIECHR